MVVLLLSLALGVALVALAVIDARTLRLPDAITLPLIGGGFAAAWALDMPLRAHAIGAGLGYLGFVALELAYARLRGRAGLGRGDAKLLAAGGAWCGVLALPVILLAASATGLALVLALRLTGRRVEQVAFGPFLALAIALGWALVVSGAWPPGRV